MEEQKIVVTKEGLAELQKEYEYLVHVEREQVIDELRNARAQGDLSENADYDAARDHQARVEARIRQLDDMLKNIELIDDKKTSRSRTVRLGSTVTLEFQDTKERETYSIVGTVESDPLNGKLSNETPLAIAIMDHKTNDTVTVLVNPPYKVKIVEIN
ncbi:MAG: transcription elongation factor GreA [Erysipelotrichaceae bacterium]|nr:transcription elongation factor GreA [Erysipelotrichaceae bacterium]